MALGDHVHCNHIRREANQVADFLIANSGCYECISLQSLAERDVYIKSLEEINKVKKAHN